MKKLLRSFFSWIDKRAKKNWIQIKTGEKPAIYLEKQIYSGKSLRLEDGTMITAGDTILEIHLNNNATDVYGKDLKVFMKMIKNEMIHLEQFIHQKSDWQVVAVYGRTLFYPILAKFGFCILPIQSNLLRRFLLIWDSLLKHAFEQKNNKLKLREPKEAWLSVKMLSKVNNTKVS